MDNEIVVKFVDNLAYQSCDERPDLRIHTFDVIFLANADVSVSDDGITWYLVGENVPDTNSEFFVDIDLDATAGVPQSISYVKLLTTFEDPTHPKLGFDLDAVEALFTEDQLCLPPPLEELEIEKFYTYTNNNWDLVCTEYVDVIVEDVVVGQECVAFREANINTEDVFALPLPDTDGTYELLGDEKRKKTVVNPGQYIQATTITVPTEQTVWFEEDVSSCSDIGTINPNKVPGGVQVVRIDTDGNVFDIDDDLVLGIGGSLSLDGTIVSVHVDDVPAGDTIRVMVKFQPSDALDIIGNECTLTANLLDTDDNNIGSATANLIIIQK